MNPISVLFLFLFSTEISVSENYLKIPEIPKVNYRILDENSGEMRSEVEFYLRGNELRARIKKLRPGYESALCESCPDDFQGKKLLGMDLIWGLKWDGSRWSGGRILDVDNGKVYSCRLNLITNERVEIRAYLGRPIFGETLSWPSGQ